MVYPRHDEQAVLLSSEFQKSADGSFAWESAVSAYLGLPALRGFWPLTVMGASGQANDLANAIHLTNNSNAQFTTEGGAPCVDFASASSQYFSVADNAAHDILGTESYVDGSFRGLTLGCWYRASSFTGTHALLSKYETTSQRSYVLAIVSSKVRFAVSNTGSDQYQEDFDATTIAVNEWRFVVGRYDPSTSVDAWLDDQYESNTTSIPASLHNSTEGFKIGAQDTTPANFADAKIAFAFLCAADLPDAVIRRLYSRTRSLFQNRSVWQT